VASDDRPLAVLGATGYTGGLVCDAARELGVRLRLLGRNRKALQARAQACEEFHVADATDHGSLLHGFEDAFGVVTTAGPFLKKGFAVVDAAIAAGVHYLDSSAEQPYARNIYERFGSRAAERGLVLLTAFGFDYVPGDLAARIAADGLGEELDEVAVAYRVDRPATSRGTRETVAEVLQQPIVAYEDGRLVPSSLGATKRRFRFPSGEASAIEWSGTEPLTVPRHTRVRGVRSYVHVPGVATPLARFGPRAAPLARLSARFLKRDPSSERRQRTRFAVVAEARNRSGGRRATLGGRDVYGVTALLLARGALALRDGEARGTGALSPAEAFEASSFLERIAPLLQLESLVDL
jgi:short subunit dehydrogenase-like uncharacterized protein